MGSNISAEGWERHTNRNGVLNKTPKDAENSPEPFSHLRRERQKELKDHQDETKTGARGRAAVLSGVP